MERCGSRQTAALCAAIRLEGPRDGPQGWTVALCPNDNPIGDGTQGAPAPALPASSLSAGWRTVTHDMVGDHVRRAARRAQIAKSGVHRLRHSFCSHLAMRGAPARAIQELAGHQDLTTTQRYMHLSSAALEGAIRLLDSPTFLPNRGDRLETAEGKIGKCVE
jgi:integrase